MICSNCGAENRAERRFCLQCGTPLASGCPNCGATNEPEARFCGNCGHSLASEPPTARAQPSDAASDRSSGTGTATTSATAAERRLVSVLFADLVGFTPFAEERDAEEVRDTLQRYFELSRQVIERYGGTVEKFIGDAVMAVWGTPTAHEDDAERAVRAALDLVDVVQTLGPGIQARAGVLTGEAAVNPAATDQGLLAGDIVNTAARLQSAAPAATVLVGESTMRMASAALTFESAGEQLLKGKEAPIPAWRALQVVAQRGGAGRSESLETPFVGRQEEFRLLRELLHLGQRDPRPRLVSITGPAGIGKSRLAWELEKYVDGVVELIYWHRGRCPAYGEGVTFWALGEMVRSRAGLSETDDAQTTRRRLAETVERYVADESERPWILSALLTLLGLEQATQSGREMLFAAWRRFFESIAARGTTVLVFEDLQWADSGLLDFIDNLLDWSKSVPLLVVTLARPELFDRRPDWGAGHRTYNALALDPLSDEQMREILAALVPDLETRAVDAIVERADGVPLYAVETVRMLLADGRLELTEGSCRPTREFGTLAVPDSLRSLITARLDDLEPADRNLLQDAAVLGQSFTLDALSAVNGATPEELETRLRRMLRRELLTVEADPRSPERGSYGFMQSLTREVAYATLARPERRARHLAAARHFEAIGGEEIAGVLAGHYLAAFEASAAGAEADAVAAQARIALRGAAERAATLGSHEQAADFLEQALRVTGEVPERAQLLERQAYELDLAGRYERSESAARTAIGLYEELTDPLSAARTRGVLGTVMIHTQRIPEAMTELEAALEQLPEDAEPMARADALAKLARAYYRNLEAERSIGVAEEALRLAEHHGALTIIADALISKGTALSMRGRHQESAALLRAGSELARREGDVPNATRGYANLATVVARIGRVEESTQIARDGLELARTAGDLGQTIWQLGNYAGGATYAGEPLAPLLAQLDEAFALKLEPIDRFQLLERSLVPAMYAGRDISADLEDYLRKTESDDSDPQTASSALTIKSQWAYVRGDYAAASRYEEEYSRARPDWAHPSRAALLAVMAGDWARARKLVEWAQEGAGGIRSEEAYNAAASGALAAAEGRPEEALAGFREGLRRMQAIGGKLEASFISLVMVSVLGSEVPEARQAAEEALATLERMGAEPLISPLRLALERPAGLLKAAPAAPGAAVAQPSSAGAQSSSASRLPASRS